MARARRRRWPAILLPCVALGAGCAATTALRGRIRETEALLRQAEQNGAYRCAPRELALGRAHARFAALELDEGNAGRAAEEFTLAEPNARAALRLSPPERCGARAAPGDRDGDGLPDNADQCPDAAETFNGYRDDDGCPDQPDTDSDGVADAADRCPVDPEDRDAYQDDDGCPEPDNDADGVPDTADRCVADPEDPDGFQDDDGCPDADNDQDTVPDPTDNCPNEAGAVDNQGCPPAFQHLQVTQHGVRFHVEFDFGRATLRPSAAATLDEVVVFLNQAHNRALRYEVGGHTDSRGSDRQNDRLSQARAETVRLYLLGRSIDGARLTARGYGERQPIESNRAEGGRQANRRVELNEIDAGGSLVR